MATATKSLLRQPQQKLVYSKDSTLSMSSSLGNNEQNILGLFKSSSSLAKSIRGINSTQASSSLAASGQLIMNNNSKYMLGNIEEESKDNINKASFKKSVSSNNPVMKIRNITHDYNNIDVNQGTYNILSKLKAEKRAKNLDAIDDYEVWKCNYWKEDESNVKEMINKLREHLDSTENEIYSKFGTGEAELINMVQSDIDNVEDFYNKCIEGRSDNIKNTLGDVNKDLDNFYKCVSLRIITLGKDLDLIGFLLEEEIKALTDEKQLYIDNLVREKRDYYTRVINEIRDKENEIVENSKKDLAEFILKWKNVKLNNYVKILKDYLASELIIDNPDRYTIIAKLKEDQVMIYTKRYELIFNKLFKMGYSDILAKKIELVNKELEDIYGEAERTFDLDIQNLVSNSDNIEKLSEEQIEVFKNNVGTISYEFTKDNKNEGKYNNYDEINDLNELIQKEIDPIMNQNKNNRTNFITQLDNYIDEYEDYTHSICSKLISLYMSIGKFHDEHNNRLKKTEMDYQVSLARASDDDDDIINEKEGQLKKTSEEMRNCINKTELDENLKTAFDILDQLEAEYREYFSKIDGIFNSHEGLVNNTFQIYEKNILKLFGIYDKEYQSDIENRRNIESDFLSRKKEAQIAYEEQKAAEEEAKNQDKNAKGAKKPAKKADKKAPPKKGEVPVALVPPREIKEFESKLKQNYLIDFTIEELVRHFLRNIIYKRDDDIFELKPKSPEELERIKKEKEEKEKEEAEGGKDKKKKGGKDSKNTTAKKIEKKDPNKTQNSINSSSQNDTQVDILNAFDPYNADANKVFTSPKSIKDEALLSEVNEFNEINIIKGLNDLFNMLQETILNKLNSKVEDDKLDDNDLREDKLTELDIRLKKIPPRKGKIEVEEYDKRLSELEKHDEKLNKHKEMINNKNNEDNEKNNKLLEDLDGKFNKLMENYENILKSIEEEQTSKGLENKFKDFKSLYYDFITELGDSELKLTEYSKTNPENLMNLNKNYLLSLQPISKGGTYSDREIEFTKNELNALDNDVIKVGMDERAQKNKEKLDEIKQKLEELMTNMQNQYNVTNENIMAKDCVGKKYGAPKRLINDIIINIKIKCNQAQEGLDQLFKELKDTINSFNGINNNTKLFEYLSKNDMPLNVRRLLSKINNCVFTYGKYIEGFKPKLLDFYNLERVLMKEDVESCEIVNKEDQDEDENLKKNEILGLGFLGKMILDTDTPATQQKGKAVSNADVTYNQEIDAIDEKVKAECAKIYTGEFAKMLNAQEKMPDSLVLFLQGVKNEMEVLRLKNVRELRTYCQNLYKYSLNIPEAVIKFIFSHSCMCNKNETEKIVNNYIKTKANSDKKKEKLNEILGPYLANPMYLQELNKIEADNNERNSSLIKCINETQYNLIEKSEKNSKDHYIRLLNNCESLKTLFDNFIFEEEFISLGDEEYFKNRQSYNELLKLNKQIEDMSQNKDAKGGKGAVDIANFDLDSKRTYKKIYKGINIRTGKINYYQQFNNIVKEYVENSEDKIKILEQQYNKDNFSKNLTCIKLQNNKNIFLNRDTYYKMHCDLFNSNVLKDINDYNKERMKELEYQQKWNEMIKGLKNTINNNGNNDSNVINNEQAGGSADQSTKK